MTPLLVTVAPPAHAATTLQAVRIIGGPGHAGHYGWGAETIPAGRPRAGNVLITDYWNFRITEFDQSGNVVGHPVTNDGGHAAPYDVAVNPVNGNIAFGDVDAGMQVDIYSSTGQFLRSCGNGTRWRYPAYLDYDAQGRLAVADSRGHKIVMTNDANCNVLFQFGTQGGGASQFNTPRGIDFAPDGTLWINDTNNRRVSQWSVGASSASRIKSFPVEAGDLRGLMFRNNEVYSVNAATARVNVYNADQRSARPLLGRVRRRQRPVRRRRSRDHRRRLRATSGSPTCRASGPRSSLRRASSCSSATEPPGPPPVGGYAMPEGVAADDDGTVVGVDSFNWRVNVHTPTARRGSRSARATTSTTRAASPCTGARTRSSWATPTPTRSTSTP